MKTCTLHNIRALIGLTSEEHNRLREVENQYEISTSAFVLNMALVISERLAKRQYHVRGRSPFETIALSALYDYHPFAESIKGSISYTLKTTMKLSFSELKEKIHCVGIQNHSQFFVSLLRALINAPEIASRIKIAGTYTKRYVKSQVFDRYANSNVYEIIYLGEGIRDELKHISVHAHKSMTSMIKDVIKVLCDIEFKEGYFVVNEAVFIENILTKERHIEKKGIVYNQPFGYRIVDAKLYVQMLAVMEKYGIPGKQDFYRRVVDFIIQAYKGDISLSPVLVDDDSDYNETRMIRNAFRKELVYGN